MCVADMYVVRIGTSSLHAFCLFSAFCKCFFLCVCMCDACGWLCFCKMNVLGCVFVCVRL